MAMVLALPIAAAQDRSSEASQDSPTKKKVRAKPRGRLPAYFSRVVTATQRDKIYAIQARFKSQIAKLQAELKRMEEDRDKEVYDVLTDDQKDRVAKFQDAAKKRRAARKTGKSTTSGTENGTKR